MHWTRWSSRAGATVGALLSLASAATAQSITPNSAVATINVGQTITIRKTITLGAAGATNVDLFFLADNTGSMGSIIANAKSGAAAILNNFGSGFQYGVGRYVGDPIEGVAPSTSYVRQQDLTTDKPSVQSAINAWFASGGGDLPEGNFFALKEMSNTTSWRAGAQRIVVWFGDAYAHTETVSQAAAIAALQAQGVKVVAFNSLGAGAGIDQFGQASAIVAAAGGSLTNNFLGLSPAAFVAAVNGAITSATSTINLDFFSTLVSSGLDVRFRCTDVLGCLNVGAGASREFEIDIRGLAVGTYDFNIGARGVDALATNRITVVNPDGAVVPEPATVVLTATGLLALGAISRRRRAKPLPERMS